MQIKGTCYLWGKNNKNLQLLDILANYRPECLEVAHFCYFGLKGIASALKQKNIFMFAQKQKDKTHSNTIIYCFYPDGYTLYSG